MKKKIGILGSGIVGKVLGSGFIANGHEVMIGTRDAAKLKEWQTSTGGKTGSFDEAAAFGEILVLAVKGSVASEALRLATEKNIAGKTIIDATNPIADLPPQNGVLQYFTEINRSLMERLQDEFTDAKFVKAYNSVGSAHMVNPDFGGVKPTMFICGNDDEAKKQVTAINTTFGWETSDMGKAEGARAIEPLCILWCIPGMLGGGWNHAFKLLRK
ncbi:MAG TPA: NAD(P)-binding domain-containing protein [Bacteroidia bacterium]|nr:NAD(P)-binding domain-containing protein [Bacteroidia bacterium]